MSVKKFKCYANTIEVVTRGVVLTLPLKSEDEVDKTLSSTNEVGRKSVKNVYTYLSLKGFLRLKGFS